MATPRTPTKSQLAVGRQVRSSVSPKSKKDTLKNMTPGSRPHGKSASKVFRLKMATENAYPKDADLPKLVFECLKQGLAGHEDVTNVTKHFKKDPAFCTLITDVVCNLSKKQCNYCDNFKR